MKKGWNVGNNAQRDRRWLKRLGRIKTWQLILILLIFAMMAIIFLRLNNLGMDERRNAVMAADKSGNEQELRKAATELQNYVSKHMNTSLGNGIALQNSYDRAVKAAYAAAKSPSIDPGVYQAATANCQSKVYTGGYPAYAQCVSEAVGGTSAENFKDVVLPNDAAYYLMYASPRWSLDGAGITLFICLIIIIVIIVRTIAMIVLKLTLKFKYHSV